MVLIKNGRKVVDSEIALDILYFLCSFKLDATNRLNQVTKDEQNHQKPDFASKVSKVRVLNRGQLYAGGRRNNTTANLSQAAKGHSLQNYPPTASAISVFALGPSQSMPPITRQISLPSLS